MAENEVTLDHVPPHAWRERLLKRQGGLGSKTQGICGKDSQKASACVHQDAISVCSPSAMWTGCQSHSASSKQLTEAGRNLTP